MRIKILWPNNVYDENDVSYCELAGTREFKGGPDDVLLYYGSLFQKIVNQFEDEGITIDQSGDDEWIKFDLVDGLHDLPPELPHQLLSKLEAVQLPGYALWLDDRRLPDAHTEHTHEALGQPLAIARTLEEARYHVEYAGMPECLYLDHDLGPGEDAMMFLKWLYERFPEEHPPGFVFLTDNPVGRENMYAFLTSWCKARCIFE